MTAKPELGTLIQSAYSELASVDQNYGWHRLKAIEVLKKLAEFHHIKLQEVEVVKGELSRVTSNEHLRKAQSTLHKALLIIGNSRHLFLTQAINEIAVALKSPGGDSTPKIPFASSLPANAPVSHPEYTLQKGNYVQVSLDPQHSPRAGTILGGGAGYYCDAPVPLGDLVKSFHTTWTVPPKPNRRKFFAIWNAMNGGVLQPCLVWSGGGCGAKCPPNSWGLTNETYDPLAQHHYSHNKTTPTVKSGTKLEGVVTLVSQQVGRYTYKVGFVWYPEQDHCSTLPKPVRDFTEHLEAYFTKDSPVEAHRNFPPSKYLEMTDIHYVTTDGRKLHVTNWRIANTTRYVVTPSGKYTEILSDGKGGVNICFYFR